MKCTKENRLSYTEKAQAIVQSMSLEEKVYLMSGNFSFEDMMKSLQGGSGHYNEVPYPAGGIPEKGVPSMRFCDGPRGVVCGTGKSTCFPVSMCRGASFNTELEQEVGKAIGREVRAFGGNLFAGVCINLPYNPGWGRSQETYGEDSFAIGQFGAALVKGVQQENVMACVKHFAFNSMENSRFKVSVDCERRTEREVYLPHFKDCIDAGAASVMSAYNLYKGTHAGHSDYLLRKILKEEWDFDGFVMSDFVWGVKDTIEAANGGQDMEMCITKYFGDKLVQAVKEDLVSMHRIDEAALRIIRTILAFEEAYENSGKNYGDEVIGCSQHINLALKAAQQGITLLQNTENILPLDKSACKTIAVIGKLADKGNIGDYGSSRVYPAYTISPLQGIQTLLPAANVIFDDGANPQKSAEIAAQADAVIFVVGYTHNDEGEFVAVEENTNYIGATGGDRIKSLGLHQDEIALLQTAGPANKNSCAVLIGGNTIMISEWNNCVSSILMAYYPGQEGGTALAQILFGDVNPSGKIPYVLPVQESDLPIVKWETTNEYYDYYHGYAKLEKEGKEPLLPYGFGLSYTTFSIDNVKYQQNSKQLCASCTLTNTGSRDGAEVVQLYIGFENSLIDRPKKLLRGFERVELNAGQSKQVTIQCPMEKLAYYNPQTARFELEDIEYQVYIGNSSAQNDLIKAAKENTTR